MTIGSHGWRMLLVAVAMGLLAGCGVSGGEASGPSSGGSAAGGATSLESAGSRYLELVEPANCAAEAFLRAAEALPTGAPVSEARAALQPPARDAVTAYLTFAEGLQAASWPPEAQHLAEAVAQRAEEQAALYRDMGSAEDDDSFYRAFTTFEQEGGSRRQSAELRAVLGLPPNQQVQSIRC